MSDEPSSPAGATTPVEAVAQDWKDFTIHWGDAQLEWVVARSGNVFAKVGDKILGSLVCLVDEEYLAWVGDECRGPFVLDRAKEVLRKALADLYHRSAEENLRIAQALDPSMTYGMVTMKCWVAAQEPATESDSPSAPQVSGDTP